MEAQRRGGEVDERRPFGEVRVSEEARAGDVAAAAVGLDAPPVVGALQGVRGVLGGFQLDDDEAAVAPQREQIDGPRAVFGRARGAELRVQRREAEAGVEPRDVAPQE